MLTSVNVFSAQALASSEPTEPLQSNRLACRPGRGIIQTWYSSGSPVRTGQSLHPPARSTKAGNLSSSVFHWAAPHSGHCPSRGCAASRKPSLISYLGRQVSHFLLQGMGLPVKSLCRLSAHVGRLRLTQFWPRAKPYAFTSVP